jgi:hypothetical protein
MEAKVKAGETISLVDLANVVKVDKELGKDKPEKSPLSGCSLKQTRQG